MLKEKNWIAISVIVLLGTTYVALVKHFAFPMGENSYAIIFEMFLSLVCGFFYAVMYFIQFVGMAFIYKVDTKFSKVFYAFITVLFIILIWAGTEVIIHGGPDKIVFNWTYIANLIVSIIIVLKANYDGRIERRK